MARYCRYCGEPMDEGEAFCGSCGRPAAKDKPEKAVSVKRNGDIAGEKVTENVYLCPDGKYRWYYELPMMKNPTILFTVWKVLGISFGIVFLFVAIIDMAAGGDPLEALWFTLKIFLIIAAVFLAISLLAYFIVAASFGFKYIVLFEMDDECVRHIQCKKQFKKAEAIGWITAIVGAATGSPAMMGLGLSTAVRSESTSEFKNVRTVKTRKRRNVIYVNQLLNKNQVYAADADFDFVAEFIKSRCVNAKRK